jgi:VWFA-related protein
MAMRLLLVALFLATLITALSAAVVSGQTRRHTTEICRGVAIPEGYVIIAETTAPDCPRGAYVLRKQAPGAQSKAQPASPPNAAARPRRVGGSAPASEPTQPAPNGPPALKGSTTITPSTSGMQPTSAAPRSAEPEEVGEGDIVRVDTAFVTVPVSVIDRQGRYIPNLRREDFRLYENGAEQEITYFDQTEKPFTVALMLDTSGSTRFRLWDIKEAAIAFAKQLRPQDRVLVVTFNDDVLLLTEATNDRDMVSSVINYNAQTGDATRLYDAVDLVIRERLNKIPGRKAIVLFTDGVDTASRIATYDSSMREVEELDALIYPIEYDTYEDMNARNTGSITIVSSSSNWPFPGTRSSSRVIYNPQVYGGGNPIPGSTRAEYEKADHYLHGLADKTGARLYRADDPQQLARAFSMIAEELGRQYSLGYYPKTDVLTSGEQRQIKVRVNRPDLAVRARDSYIYNPSAGH